MNSGISLILQVIVAFAAIAGTGVAIMTFVSNRLDKRLRDSKDHMDSRFDDLKENVHKRFDDFRDHTDRRLDDIKDLIRDERNRHQSGG